MLSAFSSWQLGKLRLGSGDSDQSSISNVRGETNNQLQSDEVICRSSNALSILCKLLYPFSSWQLGHISEWSQLAEVASKDKIDMLRMDEVECNSSSVYKSEYIFGTC